jgi:hypothetical protein
MYNGTTVVDFGERVQNPSKITSELKETIRRKIARYDSSEYQDWLVRHPEETALLDEQQTTVRFQRRYQSQSQSETFVDSGAEGMKSG